MKIASDALELSRILSTRFGVKEFDCHEWDELWLFGGIAMERRTFSAIAAAGVEYGDRVVTVYEMETTNVEFEPVPVELQFDSFKRLGDSAMSHFDLAMIPASLSWAAILTNELETVLYGSSRFLAKVSRSVPEEFLESNNKK